MKFYEFAQFSLTLSYNLVDGMGDDYLMSSYSSFFPLCGAGIYLLWES